MTRMAVSQLHRTSGHGGKPKAVSRIRDLALLNAGLTPEERRTSRQVYFEVAKYKQFFLTENHFGCHILVFFTKTFISFFFLVLLFFLGQAGGGLSGALQRRRGKQESHIKEPSYLCGKMHGRAK